MLQAKRRQLLFGFLVLLVVVSGCYLFYIRKPKIQVDELNLLSQAELQDLLIIYNDYRTLRSADLFDFDNESIETAVQAFRGEYSISEPSEDLNTKELDVRRLLIAIQPEVEQHEGVPKGPDIKGWLENSRRRRITLSNYRRLRTDSHEAIAYYLGVSSDLRLPEEKKRPIDLPRYLFENRVELDRLGERLQKRLSDDDEFEKIEALNNLINDIALIEFIENGPLEVGKAGMRYRVRLEEWRGWDSRFSAEVSLLVPIAKDVQPKIFFPPPPSQDADPTEFLEVTDIQASFEELPLGITLIDCELKKSGEGYKLYSRKGSAPKQQIGDLRATRSALQRLGFPDSVTITRPSLESVPVEGKEGLEGYFLVFHVTGSVTIADIDYKLAETRLRLPVADNIFGWFPDVIDNDYPRPLSWQEINNTFRRQLDNAIPPNVPNMKIDRLDVAPKSPSDNKFSLPQLQASFTGKFRGKEVKLPIHFAPDPSAEKLRYLPTQRPLEGEHQENIFAIIESAINEVLPDKNLAIYLLGIDFEAKHQKVSGKLGIYGSSGTISFTNNFRTDELVFKTHEPLPEKVNRQIQSDWDNQLRAIAVTRDSVKQTELVEAVSGFLNQVQDEPLREKLVNEAELTLSEAQLETLNFALTQITPVDLKDIEELVPPHLPMKVPTLRAGEAIVLGGGLKLERIRDQVYQLLNEKTHVLLSDIEVKNEAGNLELSFENATIGPGLRAVLAEKLPKGFLSDDMKLEKLLQKSKNGVRLYLEWECPLIGVLALPPIEINQSGASIGKLDRSQIVENLRKRLVGEKYTLGRASAIIKDLERQDSEGYRLRVLARIWEFPIEIGILFDDEFQPRKTKFEVQYGSALESLDFSIANDAIKADLVADEEELAISFTVELDFKIGRMQISDIRLTPRGWRLPSTIEVQINTDLPVGPLIIKKPGLRFSPGSPRRLHVLGDLSFPKAHDLLKLVSKIKFDFIELSFGIEGTVVTAKTVAVCKGSGELEIKAGRVSLEVEMTKGGFNKLLDIKGYAELDAADERMLLNGSLTVFQQEMGGLRMLLTPHFFETEGKFNLPIAKIDFFVSSDLSFKRFNGSANFEAKVGGVKLGEASLAVAEFTHLKCELLSLPVSLKVPAPNDITESAIREIVTSIEFNIKDPTEWFKKASKRTKSVKKTTPKTSTPTTQRTTDSENPKGQKEASPGESSGGDVGPKRQKETPPGGSSGGEVDLNGHGGDELDPNLKELKNSIDGAKSGFEFLLAVLEKTDLELIDFRKVEDVVWIRYSKKNNQRRVEIQEIWQAGHPSPVLRPRSALKDIIIQNTPFCNRLLEILKEGTAWEEIWSGPKGCLLRDQEGLQSRLHWLPHDGKKSRTAGLEWNTRRYNWAKSDIFAEAVLSSLVASEEVLSCFVTETTDYRIFAASELNSGRVAWVLSRGGKLLSGRTEKSELEDFFKFSRSNPIHDDWAITEKELLTDMTSGEPGLDWDPIDFLEGKLELYDPED